MFSELYEDRGHLIASFLCRYYSLECSINYDPKTDYRRSVAPKERKKNSVQSRADIDRGSSASSSQTIKPDRNCPRYTRDVLSFIKYQIGKGCLKILLRRHETDYFITHDWSKRIIQLALSIQLSKIRFYFFAKSSWVINSAF